MYRYKDYDTFFLKHTNKYTPLPLPADKRENKHLGSFVGNNHGPINYTDTKAKCRHLKKFTCKGTARQLLFMRVFRLEIQSVMLVFYYFRPSFVDCCPSYLTGSTPPPFPVWISILYARIQCVRGGEVWGSGPQTDKHLPRRPFTGHNFRWRHFALHSVSLICQR